ncbi:hypothetical protein SPHINGOT1_70080 [Sphingomonas sp. T1]|nr:hypothetical protein SPHINGOT1_70080 [Sphingomonas sp. T1]
MRLAKFNRINASRGAQCYRWRRIPHSIERGRSRFSQFRMIVAEGVRGVIGNPAWTGCLRTTDPFLARRKRAVLIIACLPRSGSARRDHRLTNGR